MSKILNLRAFLPYRLSVLSNTVSASIAELYRREFGITVWQWRAMAVIGETPGITATDVAARTAMDKVAVSRAVAGLVDLGFMDRVASEEDARRTCLTLTEAGLDIYKKIIPIALKAETDLLAPLSKQDRTDLDRIMLKLAKGAAPDTNLW